jgi:hypothetical protein
MSSVQDICCGANVYKIFVVVALMCAYLGPNRRSFALFIYSVRFTIRTCDTNALII